MIPYLLPCIQFTPSRGSVLLRASLIPAALVSSYWDASQAKYNDSYIATEPPILRSLSLDKSQDGKDKGVPSPVPHVSSYDKGSAEGVCWFILEVCVISNVCVYLLYWPHCIHL